MGIERNNHVCATCPILDVERDARGWPKSGKVGYCRLREFSVEDLVATWCDNHPARNILGFQTPVGPIWVGDLPAACEGVAMLEEGGGETCASCGQETPGPRHVMWMERDQRRYFCSREHYLSWAAERDPSLGLAGEDHPEEVAEMRRLHRGLCAAEEGFRRNDAEPIRLLGDLLRFTGPAVYRFLKRKHLLPRTDLDRFWPDLFRGTPQETREHYNPRMLETQFALRDLLQDPPSGLPEDPGERAYELARMRWGRLILGDLLNVAEGPEIPVEVLKRHRGRHRPNWREGESHIPANARRSFYVERNPDLAHDLEQYFGAVQGTD